MNQDDVIRLFARVVPFRFLKEPEKRELATAAPPGSLCASEDYLLSYFRPARFHKLSAPFFVTSSVSSRPSRGFRPCMPLLARSSGALALELDERFAGFGSDVL